MLDREKLLAPRADTESGMPEADVEIPNVGTVRVRGLRRGEVLAVKAKTEDVSLFERKTLTFGLVDPQLSEADVGRWQETSPAGEMDVVVDVILQLSGMADDASKSGVPAAGDGPGS